MTLSILTRVRWVNVLRLIAAVAAVPLVLAATRTGEHAANVPSGAVRVAEPPVAQPTVTVPEVPAAAPPRARAQQRRHARHQRRRHGKKRQRAVAAAPPRPIVTPAAPTPAPRAAEFRP